MRTDELIAGCEYEVTHGGAIRIDHIGAIDKDGYMRVTYHWTMGGSGNTGSQTSTHTPEGPWSLGRMIDYVFDECPA